MAASSLNLGNDFGLQIKIQLVLWYQIFQCRKKKHGHVGEVNSANQKSGGIELLKLESLYRGGVSFQKVWQIQ